MAKLMKIFASLLLITALVFSPATSSFAANAQQVEFLIAGVLGADGLALDSGLVYTYSAGTTTNKTVWTDAAKTSAASNPVVLDSYGKATIYADGNYKFLIKTAAGVTVVTLDNLYFGLNPEAKTITSVATDYDILTTDFMVMVDATGGAITINLPAAASYEGREFVIVKTDAGANAVTVEGNGAETINGALNYALASQYDALRVISNASNWYIPFVVSGVSTATTTTSGISELATDAEALAETATNRVLTPANLAQYTFGYRKLGLVRGLTPAYKDADEITWAGGVVEVNGTVYSLTASLDVDMDSRFGGAFAASTWYYIYIDPPATGYTLAAADFEVNATAPSWDSAKAGYYHGVNTDWRCIGFLRSTAASAIMPFKVRGVSYRWDDPLQILSTAADPGALTALAADVPFDTTVDLYCSVVGVAGIEGLLKLSMDGTNSWYVCRAWDEGNNGNWAAYNTTRCGTNGSKQIYYDNSINAGAWTTVIEVLGFDIPEGLAR